MHTLLQDLRYGWRLLVKNPGFTAVAVTAMALGIGANTAVFSVANTILLRPLPYRDPDRLVVLNHNYPKLDLIASVSAAGFKHYQEINESFENMTAISGWAPNLTGTGEPERLVGVMASPTLFATLGVEPLRGRAFTADEAQPGRNRVVVITDGLWRRRFGSDPDLVGKSLTLNGESHTVIGIMPPGFQFGRELGQVIELYAPIAFTEAQLSPARWRNEFLTVIARLRPGITLQRAQAEMDRIAANVRRQYFGGQDAADPSSWGLLLRFFGELVVGDIRPALLVLSAAVGLVVLIACANVANLLLARATARQKEIAIRSALGAGRVRVIRQLLTESVLIALSGGLLGILLASLGLDFLLKLNQDRIPRASEVGIDSRVLLFTFGISLLTGVIFGLIPALQSSRSDMHETLKEGGRGTAIGPRRRAHNTLVVAEMALALVLMIGAGLLIRSFLRLQEVHPGFRPQNLLVMQIALPPARYEGPRGIDDFYQRMLQSVGVLPGVQSAGVASTVPMSGNNSSGSFAIEGRTVAPGEMMPWGSRWLAGSSYFQTMGIPLVRGRYFDDHDTMDGRPVAIIDDSLARRFWPGEDPVGRRISFQRDAQGNAIWREVVGIVGHVKHKGLEGESPVQYYLPQRQMPNGSMYLVIRTSTDPLHASAAVRAAIQSIDRDLPVFRVTTMAQMVSDSMAQRRFAMLLLGTFAVVALILSSVGLYGVMAYSVTQRTHEIGVRMALGAGRSAVMRMVVRQGMVLSVVGLILGVGAAFGLTRMMTALLFQISETDPLVFAGIPLLLVAVAAAASYLPARRAVRVDPIVALRYE